MNLIYPRPFLKASLSIVLLIAFLSPISAQDPSIIVIPFKISPNGDKAYHWLGRALSFYISEGLELNQFPVLPDSETADVLESHAVYFPYAMTKATALRLAKEKKQGIVLWGEISTLPEDKSLITIKSSIIYLDSFEQKYPPVLKGHVNDLYKLMDELLRAAVKTLQPVETEAHVIPVPRIHLNLRQYERFIKSRLINEHQKAEDG